MNSYTPLTIPGMSNPAPWSLGSVGTRPTPVRSRLRYWAGNVHKSQPEITIFIGGINHYKPFPIG